MLQEVMGKFSNVVVHAVSFDAFSNVLREHDVDGRMVLDMAGKGQFDLVEPGRVVAAATIYATPKDGSAPISVSAEAITQARKLAALPFGLEYAANASYALAPKTRVESQVITWFKDVSGLDLKEVGRESAAFGAEYRCWKFVHPDGSNAIWLPDMDELVPTMGDTRTPLRKVVKVVGEPYKPATAPAPAVPEDALMQVIRLVGQLEPKQRENLLAYLILTK